jgi:hypothetical protein
MVFCFIFIMHQKSLNNLASVIIWIFPLLHLGDASVGSTVFIDEDCSKTLELLGKYDLCKKSVVSTYDLFVSLL